MVYLVKTPWLVKKYYSNLVWSIPVKEKKLFLTFDDGPHEVATPFVLEQLDKYKAKATFFCLGKNVLKFPGLFRQTIDSGHAIGNHTFNHLNGRKVGDEKYFNDIIEARKYIDSDLFRPPYGKISPFQAKYLRASLNFKIIMWDVLSGDFDLDIQADKCSMNVISKSRRGSVIVFHDSQKAFPRLQKALPEILKIFSAKGYSFSALDEFIA